MELRIGTFQDYNKKVVIATEGLTLGLNDDANTVPIPPRSTSTVEGTKTKQTHPEPVSNVATGVATGGLQAASQAFLQALTYPQPHTKNKYKTMQKTTTFPKAGLIKSVQIHLDLKDGLQTVAWEKNMPRSTPARLETRTSRSIIAR